MITIDQLKQELRDEIKRAEVDWDAADDRICDDNDESPGDAQADAGDAGGRLRLAKRMLKLLGEEV